MEPAAAATAQRLPETSREDRAPATVAAAAAAAAAALAAAGGGRSPEPALTRAAPSGGAREEAPGEAQPGPLPGRAGGTGRRRRRGAPQPNAGGAAPGSGAGSGANSLLLRRGRLKRNLSATAAASSSSSSSLSSSAAAASHSPGAAGLSASCSASASLCTRSLDRKTLLLKHRQMLQLQPSDRDWVRQQLQRGCVHVFDRHSASTYLRPVLCTLDTTAGEVAARLLQVGHKGGGVVKVLGKGPPDVGPRNEPAEPRDLGPPPGKSGPTAVGAPPRAPPADLPLPRGPRGWAHCTSRVSPALSDSSPGEPSTPRPLDGAVAGPVSDTESFSLSPSAESVSDRLDPYSSGGGSSSSSEELEADPAPTPAGAPGQSCPPDHSAPTRPGADARPPSPMVSPPLLQPKAPRAVDCLDGATGDPPREEKAAAAVASGLPQAIAGGTGAIAEKAPALPTLYVQFHGETTRRLEADEKPLQIQNDYLFQLGFGELWRVQEEGMDSEIGCLIRFYAGKETTCTWTCGVSTLSGPEKGVKSVCVGQ